MLRLINHIIRTSAMRDRTEINAALVYAMEDLFHPTALSIQRCFTSERKTVVFACAGIGPGGPYARNAYLPDRRYCRPIEHDALMLRCRREMSVAVEILPDGSNRLIFPVIQLDHLLYIIDITVPESFPADQRVLLMGLVEYFSNLIALLDYGETDTLTGLANRKTFDKHLFEVLGKATSDDADHAHARPDHAAPQRRQNYGGHSRHWLAVCDIDHFKSINDTYGHLMGDEVLVVLSQLMRQSFRFDDQLFRFGGEEFVIVLQPARQESAFVALDRFRHNIESHNFSRVGRVTISVGYSELLPYDTPSDAIDRADEALYYVKQHGRNGVASYESLIESGKLAAKEVSGGDIELF